MSATNGSAIPQEASEITDKGKGKSVEPAASHEMMDEDEEDSEEEESGVEDVRGLACLTPSRVQSRADKHVFIGRRAYVTTPLTWATISTSLCDPRR